MSQRVLEFISPLKAKGEQVSENCEECIKDDFIALKNASATDNKWQSWGIKLLFGALIVGGCLNGWAAYASSDKDSKQDSRLAAVETQNTNTGKELVKIDKKIDALITLSNQTNCRQKSCQFR